MALHDYPDTRPYLHAGRPGSRRRRGPFGWRVEAWRQIQWESPFLETPILSFIEGRVGNVAARETFVRSSVKRSNDRRHPPADPRAVWRLGLRARSTRTRARRPGVPPAAVRRRGLPVKSIKFKPRGARVRPCTAFRGESRNDRGAPHDPRAKITIQDRVLGRPARAPLSAPRTAAQSAGRRRSITT